MPKENQYSHISSNARLRNTTAMILAGGKGTRLKELTSNIAKPAVSFGGKFKIIDFTLSNCINSGIRRVGVLTQYMAHDSSAISNLVGNRLTLHLAKESISSLLSSVSVKIGIVVPRMLCIKTLISLNVKTTQSAY